MTDRELMQQVLDLLDDINQCSLPPTGIPLPAEIDHVMEALRDRLANEFNPDWDAMAVMVEEQQRMAKRIEELEAQPDLITHADVEQLARIEKLVEDVDPYTAPPQREWQGLTTQEIADETDIATSSNKDIFDIRKAFWCGARWAEAKLKEKNND